MNILVVGSGAREHALVWKLLQSPLVKRVLVAPGNAGTAQVAQNLPVSASDIDGLVRAAQEHQVDLVVVGPEGPLADGLVDHLKAADIPAFGPTQRAAAIESSKAFAKDLMQQRGIPCAKSVTFSSLSEAISYVKHQPYPLVIKADGLAAGKGVVIVHAPEEAVQTLTDMMQRHVFGAAGEKVVVEEYLSGKEVSLLAFTDGKTVMPMVPACDYKRVFDGDQGLNTGGMGSYSPPGFFGPEMIEQVKQTMLEPTVAALAEEGRPYQGVLYVGLIMMEEGPKVLEFNARFGDPETQAVLPRLKTDLLEIMLSVVQGDLSQTTIEWSNEACVGVVLTSEGYPGSYRTGYPITGLNALDKGVVIFHAGTAFDAQKGLVTAGGRVLTVVATGRTMGQAREKVYQNIPRIHFQGCHYRKDIALRELVAPAV